MMRHLSRNIYHFVKERKVDRQWRLIDGAPAGSGKLLTVMVEVQDVLSHLIYIYNTISSRPFFNVCIFIIKIFMFHVDNLDNKK